PRKYLQHLLASQPGRRASDPRLAPPPGPDRSQKRDTRASDATEICFALLANFPQRRGSLRMTTRVRQWLIVLSAVVLLTAAYAVAGFVGVPHLLRSQMLSFVSEKYHRTASVGEIRFNPFTAALEVHDFMLPDADGQPMLSFGRLRVDLGFATVWRGARPLPSIQRPR